MSFAEATLVTSIAPDRYSVAIEPGWDIVGNANGGYLLAIPARAASASTAGLRPVSVTGHFLAPGWLQCQLTTRFISGGYREEDGEVWDASGRLVAQSRQLALLPRA